MKVFIQSAITIVLSFGSCFDITDITFSFCFLFDVSLMTFHTGLFCLGILFVFCLLVSGKRDKVCCGVYVLS